MNTHSTLLTILALQGLTGCSRFVWNEEPFTPDQAPTTEIIASPDDTTYVLHGTSYYLLAQQRSDLWNREVVDDVAWRYRALFREPPPSIAVRIDTVAGASDTATTWRGVPLGIVATRRPAAAGAMSREKRNPDALVAEDSARARRIGGPMLAATAAQTWLKARTLVTTRSSDSQPGGSERPSTVGAALPAWMEAGTLRMLGSAGAPDRAAAELRANRKGIIPLESLFGVSWQRAPNDASALFIAQSVSVLSFIHERDAALVARLADELPRGTPVSHVLATSATLPHDVGALDAEWRKWLQRSARRR